MPDFFARKDLATVTAFTDAGSLVDFDYEMSNQTVRNRSSATIEISFDGINRHQVLDADGTFGCVTSWDDHKRRKLSLRAIAPAGATLVDVLAGSR